MSDEENQKKFREITAKQSVDEQAMTFLRSFVGEFQGKFEEVLNLAEEFKTFAEKMKGHIQELDEFECHRFLEMKGLAKTVKDMRDDLKAIDLDNNNHVAFIEFLLFTYKKTTKQMFEAKPSDHLIAQLEEAIRKYKEVFEERKKKTKNEMGAIAAKLAAKRALRNPEGEALRMYEDEQKRVEEEKRQAEIAAEKARRESRDRLAAKAALFK